LDNEKSGVKGLLDTVYGLEDFDMSEFKAFEEKLAEAMAVNGSETSRATYELQGLETKHANLELAHGRIMDLDFATESTSLAKRQILTQSSSKMLASANKLAEVALQVMGV